MQAVPGDAGIFDANGPLLRSWFIERGHAAPRIDYVADDRTQLRVAMNEALLDCDLLLTTGGVSVGDHDLVRPVAEEIGVREVRPEEHTSELQSLIRSSYAVLCLKTKGKIVSEKRVS